MMSKDFVRQVVPFVACAAICLAGGPAGAGKVAAFYSGKTVAIYVAAPDGGGYGLYARMLCEFMSAHLPGRPAMKPRFMAGDEGVKAANYVYNKAPKDGTAVALLLPSQLTTEATGRRDVRYKSANLNWIGRIVDVVNVVTVRRDAPATTIEALRTTELAAGAGAPGSASSTPFAMMNWALGTRFRIVRSDDGRGGAVRAFERGDVQAVSASWNMLGRRLPGLLKEIQLVQIALTRDKAHSDVPLLRDLVSDPEKKAVITFLSRPASIGRTLSAPPGVPQDRITALRKAFDATMKDPAFVAAAGKRKLRLAPLTGKQLEEMVLEELATPVEIIRIAKTAAGLE